MDGVRTRRDFGALERRRMRACELFDDGMKQADVARVVKASRQSVSRWHFAWEKQGAKGLRAAGRAGRKPKLDGDQLAAIEKVLLAGPKVAGYKTEVWTLPRIAKQIRATTGVEFPPGRVWRL